MRFTYSVHVRCACPEGQKCSRIWRKDGKTWDSRHGSAGFACRIPTSGGTKLLKRFGYASKADAKTDAERVGKLLDLAADDATRARIGDLIAGSKRGAELPAVEDVRRRLGLGLDPGQPGAGPCHARGVASPLSGSAGKSVPRKVPMPGPYPPPASTT